MCTNEVSSKVYYFELRPDEFCERLAQKPLAYIPLGTLEWHGEHLPLGSDLIISQHLMAECARRIGGIVFPPLFLGPDRNIVNEDGLHLQGMDYDPTTIPPRPLEGSCYWVPEEFFRELIDKILTQVARAGFQAVFADGHGPSRQSWIQGLNYREKKFGLKLLGITDEILDTWSSQIDHAALNETSQVIAIRDDLVDLDLLPANRSEWPQGVDGEDPRNASPTLGQEYYDKAVSIVQEMAEASNI